MTKRTTKRPSGAPSTGPAAVSAAQAVTRCDPSGLGFASTSEVEPMTGIFGQDRALGALRFGARMQGEGFNLYVLGRPGSQRHDVVMSFLEAESQDKAQPDDWCYVNNFQDPQKPRGLALPAGWGARLKADMAQLVDDLRASIPAAFESENYRERVAEIEKEFQQRYREGLEAVQAEAEAEGMGLLPTPHGFAIAPVKGDRVLAAEEFEELPEDERERVEAAMQRLTERLRQHLSQLPAWHKERRARIRELDRNVTMLAVGALIEDMIKHYAEFAHVVEFLHAVQQDVVDNAHEFRAADGESEGLPAGLRLDRAPVDRRYQVNALMDNSATRGAPVVYEQNPTHPNLVGRIEHSSQFGALVTDFTLVRPGALHAASGGYLVLDTEKVLLQPFAWEALKRALKSGRVTIESAAQMLGLMAAQGLEPDPMPLAVKVVLVGNRLLYYLLCELDPEFLQLFKVPADFEDHMPRTAENVSLYGRMIATMVQQKRLAPFSAGAVARVIDESSRLASDTQRLSTRLRVIGDLVSEADFWARERQSGQVEAQDIAAAVEQRRHRTDRLHTELKEAIRRETIHVATEGARTAQVNGLSVMQLGEYLFGQPSRITATVRVGDGQVVDIEREVELGGAIHSKGVLILSSFVGARYSREWPLSFSASLVFEQSYGGVDGDSASVAEVVALLSAIADIPVRQDLAVTGSVDQHGMVQAIGGVNEKIEGFFEICSQRGLSGTQGVLIPADNVQHLMLREDVAEAMAAGRFSVYPMRTVDDALALFTGMEPGARGADGAFPEDSFNGRVQHGLTELARQRQKFRRTKPDSESAR